MLPRLDSRCFESGPSDQVRDPSPIEQSKELKRASSNGNTGGGAVCDDGQQVRLCCHLLTAAPERGTVSEKCLVGVRTRIGLVCCRFYCTILRPISTKHQSAPFKPSFNAFPSLFFQLSSQSGNFVVQQDSSVYLVRREG